MSRGDRTPDGAAGPRRPSRLRRFFLRHVPLTIAGGAALLLVALTGFYFWASSAQCERLVRRWLVAKVEAATGGRVEIASFEWHLLRLEADAGGVTVHGREGAGEAPYAEIGNLRVQLSVLGLVSPHVELRELDVERPSLHLIVYPDGTTNVPTPARKRRPGKPMLETLFDAKAGRVSIEDGTIDYDNRAAAFDFQNRYAPLDLRARDVSVVLGYAPATRRQAESYRIEVGATDLSLVRGGPRSKAPVGHGRLQAVVDLARTAAYLRRLELVTWEGKGARQKLEITGQMEDFAHPHWQAKARGDLDMALFDPATGFPYTPEGVAHVELTGAGADGQFRADGSVHVEDGSYIGTGVRAQGVRLDARVHADASELMISRVVARLRQGGEIDGTVALMHWLPPVPGAAVMAPADPEIDPKVTPRAATRRGRREGARGKAAAPEQTFVRAKPLVIPVDGKVRAEFKRVSLDTILDMVSEPPFQRLGIDAAVNGTATAAWAKGDPRSVQVSAQLNLSPSGAGAPGENPARGVVDATYTQRDGAVNLRELSLAMPGTRLEAKGHLGAYPVTSPTAVALDFESSNLADFDTVLRALGLHRDGKAGVAALPVSLAGQASFRGTWTGSLVQPRIGGVLQATQLGVEMPAAAGGQPRLVHFDSAEATGSYAAARISIQQAVLERGAARLDVSGTLDAQGGGPGERTGFGADSEIHAQMEATKVAVSDLQPFVVAKLPVTGTLDAQLSVGGPLQAPNGSGWVELNGGSLYGEPVKRARVQGSLENRILHLTSAVLSEPAGSVSGSGSYDLKSRQFQAKAAGAGIDVGRVAWFRRHGLEATGKLWFTASGSGTPEAPQLAGDAVLNGLTLSGQPVGGLQLTARTENRMLKFNATTRLEGAELTLNGQTELSGGLATQATAKFSEFNIAALLQQAHVEGLTGESSLAGTISLDGPLRDPAAMRGEAQLKELAVTLAGVHLKSEGGLHATLADGTIHLDPLHVTGEDTDLHAQGTMELNGARRMDFSGNGAINLKLAETLDPDVTAAGETTFEVRAHGPLKSPNLEGRIDFQNGSLSLGDIPNGLSQLHGTLVFNENRLEVRSLTAMSGGGLLSVGGYLAYQHGIFADLSVTGKGIRIRYPPGISSLADTTLRLEGPERNLLLTGNVLITRFTVSPDLDVAALAVQANAAVEKVAPPEAPSNHIRLDVHIVSSPQLNFQNAYAKLAGDVNLRVRGTVANPSLLGRVSLTEGAATIAGTRYELQHGEITFTNPVRIEPNVDMSATARVDDYDVTLEVHGTPPDRMTVNYRSDPPLPETDVISLLALGHTQNQERLYTQQQQQSLTNPTTDALLGGALNATVSSRVQKLFGAGSVKIDPNYLGALGNSTSRITVQEQFGRNVTLTYATDVDTTGQQLLQAEFAVNRHVSLVVARDESGVFSMVIKATRRYK